MKDLLDKLDEAYALAKSRDDYQTMADIVFRMHHIRFQEQMNEPRCQCGANGREHG